MHTAKLNLYLIILAVASCGFPRLSELPGASDGGERLPLSLELLAGDIGGPGNGDGTGTAARFGGPIDAAVDSASNVYVADSINHTIRKVTADGIVTTLAGTAGMSGSADGTGVAARFYVPAGVAADSAGNVYVADFGNETIRKITAAGNVTTLAGTAGMCGSTDGTGATARFSGPTGVAVDTAGNVYVADMGNNTIRKITATGIVTTLAGTAGTSGSADGTGAAARFSFSPGPILAGVAVDTAGNVYVADKKNATIRKITAGGVVTTLAGTAGMLGSVDGTGAAARFFNPTGVAADGASNVYVADAGNATIRKITAAGVVTTLAGTPGIGGSADGTGAASRFAGALGVAVDGAGTIYVADYGNYAIRKITTVGIVTTLAGAAAMSGSADGASTAAHFDAPTGVAVDSTGNVFVADLFNQTIRKIMATGVVTTLAGSAGMAGSVDGTSTAARFGIPTDVAVDSAGNVFVADQYDQTIRKITAAGIVTTLAGSAGILGSIDGTGTAARFDYPSGVAVDSADNVYVADSDNHAIRKVSMEGVVTTLAGMVGMSGSADGAGAAARFYHPTSVAVDSTGNVYVADSGNHTIRKVTAGGVVTTLAGTAGMTGSVDGTGTIARFNYPSSVAVDNAGNVYVADLSNSTIRKIGPTGTTTTVAGTAGVAGILLGETPRFASPRRLAISGDSLVISDANAILLLRHGAQ